MKCSTVTSASACMIAASTLAALLGALNIDCGGVTVSRLSADGDASVSPSGSGSSSGGSGSSGSVSGSSSGGVSGSSSGNVSGSSGGVSGSSSGGVSGSGSGTLSGSSSGATSSGSSGGGSSGGGACAPNPLNYDIPGNGCDDDGDGIVDNRVTCDQGAVPPALAAAGTAADFAAAVDLCQLADATHWGVVSAVYTNGHSQTGAGPNNFAAQHGVLQTFGSVVVPREGGSLAALSTGSATAEDSDFQSDGVSATGAFKGCKLGMQSDPGGVATCGSNVDLDGGTTGNSGDVPAGFPKAAAGCANSTVVADVIDVKLQLKVPANAVGLTFDFDFHGSDWPEFVCTEFNDSFIAYLQSAGFNGGSPDNISFDSVGSPISVNNRFFDVCTPGTPTGCSSTLGTVGTSVCSAGPAQLAGTGFDDPGTYCTSQSTGGGATGWLTSQAPVKPGETISLELIIWDTSDWSYDSSVLIDNVSWTAQPVPPTPVTFPSPPK